MPSLREILPIILGGAAGALSPQGADAVQTAAAWSNKLKQQEKEDKRRDQVAGQSARRLEIAEEGEARSKEAHKMRVTATELAEKRYQKSETERLGQIQKVEDAKEGALEKYMQVYPNANREEIMGDIGLLETPAQVGKWRKDYKLDLPSLKEGQERIAGAPSGQGLSVATRGGQAYSTSTAREVDAEAIAAEQLAQQELLDDTTENKIEQVRGKHEPKIREAEREAITARMAFDQGGTTTATGGSQEGARFATPDRTALQATMDAANDKVTSARQTMQLAIDEVMLKAGVPRGKRDEYFNPTAAEVPAGDDGLAAVEALCAQRNQ